MPLSCKDIVDGVWYQVIEYLTCKDVIAIGESNKYFANLTKDSQVPMSRYWQSKCVTVFPLIKSIDYIPEHWYKFYQTFKNWQTRMPGLCEMVSARYLAPKVRQHHLADQSARYDEPEYR